ncbi:MAG: allophanate hydrolase [Bacteroidetes bacterium HGW-Bacteroidetes-17]|nr:MAG: allophanate hydrolase [Bacteroidetes bacterium HGW-Bacteroidetes-17]
MKIIPSGDSAMLVRFGNEITEKINTRVHDLHFMLDELKVKGIIEMVPAYTDLLILYDPLKVSYDGLNQIINEEIKKPGKQGTIKQRIIEIPVCYDEEFGSDLAEVSEHTGLSKDEIIRIHSNSKYLVYMLGFTPGFSYLGGMDERIACPRKKIPRQNIPAGSVGIADKQTGIYPIESPGGWQLIGRTPLNLFNPEREEVFLCQAGDQLQFIPIEKVEFESIKIAQNK